MFSYVTYLYYMNLKFIYLTIFRIYKTFTHKIYIFWSITYNSELSKVLGMILLVFEFPEDP